MPRSMAEVHAMGRHATYPRPSCPACRVVGPAIGTPTRLFLVVSEGAWWPLDAHLPPSGAYGADWCVMRAVSGPDALRQAPAAVTGQLPVSGDAGATCLSERDARAAFAREGA